MVWCELTDTYPQGETGISLLKKIDSIVDRVVVVDYKSTTTTYSTTIRKKITKLFLNATSRRMLKTILELEAFTSFTIQSLLTLSKHQVNPLLRFLDETGIIEKRVTVKTAPRTTVYLLNGGNESRINDAVARHFDLMPRGTVKMLECYVDEGIIDSIIMKVEKASLGMSVKKTVVTDFVKEELGTPLNYTMVLDTLSHFRERGWTVVQ